METDAVGYRNDLDLYAYVHDDDVPMSTLGSQTNIGPAGLQAPLRTYGISEASVAH